MLQNAQTEIQDLKQQVDDALESENMLMQLTERNLMLGEKIEEMRITIEDLEALKELTDELEENHVETERMLNEDLGECATVPSTFVVCLSSLAGVEGIEEKKFFFCWCWWL